MVLGALRANHVVVRVYLFALVFPVARGAFVQLSAKVQRRPRYSFTYLSWIPHGGSRFVELASRSLLFFFFPEVSTIRIGVMV